MRWRTAPVMTTRFMRRVAVIPVRRPWASYQTIYTEDVTAPEEKRVGLMGTVGRRGTILNLL